jgi:hypothetical protein
VPVVISHHKTTGVANFGRTAETLPKIAATMAGQEIGLDAYPYIASSTVLRRERIEDALKVLITWSKAAPEQAGRELDAIARDWGIDIDAAVARLQPAGAIYWMMDEADVRRVLEFGPTMIGSDGLPHDVHPHPRLWGTFPRVLGHYCREVGLFGLEQAVRKMTGLSAARFGLAGRGVVAAGVYADLCVFDAESVIDRASFAEPTLPAAGIERLLQPLAHRGDLVRPRRPVELGHGADPQCRMPDQAGRVERRRRAIECIEVIGEMRIGVIRSIADQIQGRRRSAVERQRRKADPAIAGNDGGDPLAGLRRHIRRSQECTVVVGVHIDKPRRDDLAGDIDLARAGRLRQPRTDLRDPGAGDGDIRRVARPAAAIDDSAAAQDQVDHHEILTFLISK